MSLPSHPSTTSPPPPEPVSRPYGAVAPSVDRRSATAVAVLVAVVAALLGPLLVAAPAGADPAPAAGSYVSLAPSRILDTRSGLGAPRAMVPTRGEVTLTVLGRGGIPVTGVGAVALNVTVTDTAAPGYVTVYPTGVARPTASNLNFVAKQSVPNLVVVKVGSNGQVTLFSDSARPVDLVADVAGYYVDGTATRPGTLTPVAPTRLLDTRNGTGTTAGRVPAQGEVSLQVTGRGGVPTGGVSAVVLNVTATGGDTGGFVTAYPNGSPRPTASNLNYVPASSVANLVVAKLGPDGRVNLFNGSTGRTDLVADLAGWFVDGAAVDAGAMTSLVPSRILDTRADVPHGTPGPVAGQATQSLRVLGVGGVPSSGVSAVVLNVTVTETSAPGYVTAYPGGTNRPTASNLNYVRGQTVPNLVVVKVGSDGTVRFFNGSSASTQLVADVAGYVRDATVVPPSAVSGVQATATPTSVTLTWTNPTDATYAGVMVRRTVGSTPPSDPTDGVLVADVPAPGASYTDQPLLPGVTYSYALFAHDSTPAYSAGTTVTASTGTTSVTGTVSGVVRDAAGTHNPLAGVVVTVASPTTASSVTVSTGSDGRYTAAGLKPGSDYTVCLTGSAVTGGSTDTYGYAPSCHLGQSGADGTVFVTAAQTTTVDGTMTAAGGVDGTVTDATTTLPISGAQVRVGPAASVLTSAVAATTGSDGRYRLTGLLPGASLVVCFTAAGHGNQCFDGQPGTVGATPVTVTSGASRGGVDAHLTTAASLGGVVQDLTGHGLGGVTVQALQDGSVVASVLTRPDGSYTVPGLAPGLYSLLYVGRDGTGGGSDDTGYLTTYLGGTDPTSATLVSLNAGESKDSLDVDLSAAGAIVGRVTDAGGSHHGLLDVHVTASSASQGGTPPVLTGPDGSYVLKGLPVGTDYTVCFTVDLTVTGGAFDPLGYLPVCLGGAGTITVAGGVKTTQDVALAAGGAIRGTVTDALGTHALANVVVTAVSGGLTLGTTMSAPDGSYTLPSLAARSDYKVCFTPTPLTSGGTSLLGYQAECWLNRPTPLTATNVAVTAGSATTGINGTLAPLLGLP